MNRYLAGALAGAIATVPMTWAMNRMHRRLPRRERYPLPPRLITERVAAAVDVADDLTGRQHEALALASHYAYGAAVGAGCAPVIQATGAPPVVAGVGYGLAVWGASYLGWIPALRILRPATEHPARRVAMMLAAHMVWGAATGYLTARLSRWNTPASPARAAWTDEDTGATVRRQEEPAEVA
ncbi:MAG TPA: hypothetical protein VD995_06720 [Azospirillum sp.]|nr:hypothetical protein [Azospirillum sp.]